MNTNLNYLPFQKDGIEWLILHENALLADQMGLGKTVQAIGLINALPSIKRTLVICPASLKINWKNEIMTWSARPCTVHMINSKSEWIPAGIVIINYEQVPKFRTEIDNTPWDLLICDESHYLKNAKSQRTQLIFGHWDDDPKKRIYPIKAARRLCMTGTPVLNRPKELWTTVRALDRQGLGKDWHHFHTHYCGAYKDKFGWQLDGASNLEELNRRLKLGIMLRRKKEEVLPQLPPKRRQIIMLEPTTVGAKQALKNEAKLAATEETINILRAKIEALSVNQASEEYKKAVQRLSSYETVSFGESAKIRHATATAKLPMAMDYLVNVLDNEDKIVVFAHHHDVIDTLVEGLAEYGVVSIDGRAEIKKRQEAVDRFQHDPKVRVIVGSIGAMGSGYTLHAASYVGFVELDWVPGNMNQAEDRLHRIGQKQSILIQHLMLNGSFDGRMAKSVMHKQQVIERAIG